MFKKILFSVFIILNVFSFSENTQRDLWMGLSRKEKILMILSYKQTVEYYYTLASKMEEEEDTGYFFEAFEMDIRNFNRYMQINSTEILIKEIDYVYLDENCIDFPFPLAISSVIDDYYKK